MFSNKAAADHSNLIAAIFLGQPLPISPAATISSGVEDADETPKLTPYQFNHHIGDKLGPSAIGCIVDLLAESEADAVQKVYELFEGNDDQGIEVELFDKTGKAYTLRLFLYPEGVLDHANDFSED